jgi:hypothetical protein
MEIGDNEYQPLQEVSKDNAMNKEYVGKESSDRDLPDGDSRLATTSPKQPDKVNRVQLPITFQQACSYPDERKVKILSSQAKRITHLQEWEVKELIKLCNHKEKSHESSKLKRGNWINKGMVRVHILNWYCTKYMRNL